MGNALVEGQDWLIKRMKKFGYKADKKGVCTGVVFTAIEAILLNMLNKYDDLLYKMYEENTINELHDKEFLANEKRKNLLLKAKSQGLSRNSFFNELTEEENELLQIRPLFEAIEIYQQLHLHPQLSSNNRWPIKQEPVISSSFVSSKKLEEKGGLCQLDAFTGIYTIKELEDNLREWRLILEKNTVTYPIPLTIDASIATGVNHIITFFYDLPKNKWTIINPSFLTSNNKDSENELVNSIARSFTLENNPIISMHTRLYTTGKEKEVLQKYINQWHESELFKKLHTVTKEKILSQDNNQQTTWLYWAIIHNDHQVLNDILNQLDGNEIVKHNITLLNAAISSLDLNLTKFLINKGANIANNIDSDITPPLFLAIELGFLEAVNLLIDKGCDVNLMYKMQTPLIAAIKQGQPQIVKLLLEHGANPAICFKLNIDDCYLCGEGWENIERMRLFVDEKLAEGCSPADIPMTAKDIALIYGYEDIAKMIQTELDKKILPGAKLNLSNFTLIQVSDDSNQLQPLPLNDVNIDLNSKPK